MALIKRLSRLFAADLHAVLDQIEEPEALLKQAVREMEEELARRAARLKALERERTTLAKRRGELERTLTELDEKLDLCFAAGNDELARKLTRRKLLTVELEQRHVARGEALDEDLATLRGELGSQQDQLELMRQKAELFAIDERGRRGERGDAEPAVSDEELEVAFLKEKRAREKRPGTQS